MNRGLGVDVDCSHRLQEGEEGGPLAAVVGTHIRPLVLAHGDLPRSEHPSKEGLVRARKKRKKDGQEVGVGYNATTTTCSMTCCAAEDMGQRRCRRAMSRIAWRGKPENLNSGSDKIERSREEDVDTAAVPSARTVNSHPLAVAAGGRNERSEMSALAQQTAPRPSPSTPTPSSTTPGSSTVRPAPPAPSSSLPPASTSSTAAAKASAQPGQYAEYKLTSLRHSSSIRNHVMKLHAPRVVDPFTTAPPTNPSSATDPPNTWSHPLKLHRRDPSAAPLSRPLIYPADPDSKDVKPAVDVSVIAPFGGAQKAKKDLFKPKTKQVFHADPQELQLRNEERLPWVLEDFEGKNTWVGTLEGGGASGHALFLFEKDGFKFVPVDRTYRFTKKASNQVLTAEEAEAQMKKRNTLPRWVYKDNPSHLGSGEGGSISGQGGGGGRSSRLFTVRESRNRTGDAVEEDLDYDDNEFFADDEENPILEGDEEANKAIEDRVRREMLGARNFESKEDELDDMDDLFGSKKVTKEGRRTKRYLKKLEGKGDYESDDEDENPYATEELSHK